MSARNTALLAGLAALLGVAVLSPPTAIGDVEQFKMHIEEDAPGYDYQQFDPPSLSYCQSRCQEEAQCKAFTYNTVRRVCFLKHKAGFPLRPHSEAITGRKTGSDRFSIRKNRDAPGNDYERIDPPTLGDCQTRCGAASECAAFTYNVEKQVCFLKYGIGTLRARDDAITGVKVAETPQTPRPTSDDGFQTRFEVPLTKEAGTFKVPVVINDVIELAFTVDSGAAHVSIPADVVMTLFRTGTLKDSDFRGKENYVLADGSTVPSETFRIRKLRVGSRVIENVTGSVADVRAPLLLGQSFLSRFSSWSIDNQKQVLVLE